MAISTPPVTASSTHCLSPSRLRRTVDVAPGPARYARMFPELPAFEADEAFLHALGRAGGICDCGDEADAPTSLSEVAAGWPIFGQFVAHDITADRSALQSHVDPQALRNARRPALDLECLYGDGPVGHPFLYQRDDPAKLLLGVGGHDVPRNVDGIAIIGDPRNDSHMVVAQLHLAMLKVHNTFVDAARRRGVPEPEVFASAVGETRRHYQFWVLREFLPSLVGQAMVDEVIGDGHRWFRPSDDVFIPLEFADAAYRYGHSQIRQRYRMNQPTEPVSLFPDLLGFRPIPCERAIDWTLFFDVPGTRSAQRARKIDGRMVPCLIHLPVAMTGASDAADYHSLAVRDLQRGQGVGLPSGEAVARHIGVKPLSAADVGLGAVGWSGETPLWYYILREADLTAAGERLGPVGGRIVAEVVITLLERDPDSVISHGSDFQSQGSLIDLLGQSAPDPTVPRHAEA
jgi:hypothetical protein